MSNQPDPMDCVSFNTRKVARLLGQLYDRALEPSGLKNTQFAALGVAAATGPISITDLSRMMETERTTLTRNLQVLERDGLIKLGAGVDGRSKTVVVTPKGRRRHEVALPLWAETQEHVLQAFGRKRWQSLRGELDAMRASLHA
jgi:DNA-binding MarR family transcriptional regulator